MTKKLICVSRTWKLLLFLPHFLGAPKKRVASASKASGCILGGTQVIQREEPGKQKPRSCRTQELARSSAQENGQQKMEGCLSNSKRIVLGANYESRAQAKKVPKLLSPFEGATGGGAPKTERLEVRPSRSDHVE
jgi:hypothetical protein